MGVWGGINRKSVRREAGVDHQRVREGEMCMIKIRCMKFSKKNNNKKLELSVISHAFNPEI